LAGIVLFVGVVVGFAGEFSPGVLGGLLFNGFLAVTWIATAALAGDLVLRICGLDEIPSPLYAGERVRVRGRSTRDSLSKKMPLTLTLSPEYKGEGTTYVSPLHCITAAAVGLGIYSLLILGLGLLGWLNRATVICLPLLSVILWSVHQIWFGRGTIRKWREGAGDASSYWSWLWLAAVPFLAIAAVGASLLPGCLWMPPSGVARPGESMVPRSLWWPSDPHPYDVVSYHLQIPREFYQVGRIVGLHHNVFSYFPMNQEMHYLGAMELCGGPWAGMYVCQFLSLLMMLLAVLAVSALVLEHFGEAPPGQRRAAATIAGVLAAAAPWTAMLGSVAYVESGLLLFGTLTAAWALCGARGGPGFLRRLALAGVLAGLAAGVKYTALPLLVAIPVALLVLPSSLRWKESLSGCAVFVAAAAAVLAPWLLRDWIWTGNPVFPLAMGFWGHAHFTLQQVQRFVQAHAPAANQAGWSGHALALWRQILANWQFAFVVIPAGFVAALGCRKFAARFLLILLLGQAIFWIGFTHLEGRFFCPAIPLAAAAVGLALAGRRIWAGLGLALVTVACGLIGLIPALNWELHHSGQDLRVLFFLSNPASLRDEPGDKVALIGDGRAFLHPARDLLYRTVFDVKIPPGQSVEDAWLGAGRSRAQLQSEGYFLEIDRAELERFSQTYYGIPPPQK
jgi:hypothetical protein